LLSPGCEGFDAIFTSRGLARAVFLFEVGHPSSIERIDHHFDARTRSALRPPAPLARGFSVPQMLSRNGRRRARAEAAAGTAEGQINSYVWMLPKSYLSRVTSARQK
jgi:hypothetical protein